MCLASRYAIGLRRSLVREPVKRNPLYAQMLLSAEHAAMFCPEGSNLQLRISAWRVK